MLTWMEREIPPAKKSITTYQTVRTVVSTDNGRMEGRKQKGMTIEGRKEGRTMEGRKEGGNDNGRKEGRNDNGRKEGRKE